MNRGRWLLDSTVEIFLQLSLSGSDRACVLVQPLLHLMRSLLLSSISFSVISTCRPAASST
ncbi:hypothetical protein KFK09_003289 [Dendrobium nobile]|uniref:Uncharacterized protein n=1 Tax=Dendrobium nobile TaxID=94219 RepID=A0A8T3C425_DENNO|nr:hypothetical protein KFK09_003289 [Dendrobium nobile]